MKKLIILLLISAPVAADQVSVESVTERDSLILSAWNANIDVRSSDTDTLTIDYDCVPPDSATEAPREDGLRVVRRAGVRPELTRNDDRIIFRAREESGDCRMTVTAPTSISLDLRINNAGRVTIEDWLGAVTAWSAAGDVDVTNQRGPFSITAMSGDATVEYSGETLASVSAVTVASGTLRLALPAQPPLTLRAKARWGDVLTDLDVNFIEEAQDDAFWSVTELGDGGPVVTLRNLNSDIVITKTLPAVE